MHTYDSQWASVIPFLPKGNAVPQQVENRGLVPKPKSDDERRIRMTTPIGAMTYIAADIRTAIDIANANGFDISHDLAHADIVLPGPRLAILGAARQNQEGAGRDHVHRRRPDRGMGDVPRRLPRECPRPTDTVGHAGDALVFPNACYSSLPPGSMRLLCSRTSSRSMVPRRR